VTQWGPFKGQYGCGNKRERSRRLCGGRRTEESWGELVCIGCRQAVGDEMSKEMKVSGLIGAQRWQGWCPDKGSEHRPMWPSGEPT
jgi:hypothetical protein